MRGHNENRNTVPVILSFRGLYWTRTNDPRDVNTVLYQLSQQTIRSLRNI